MKKRSIYILFTTMILLLAACGAAPNHNMASNEHGENAEHSEGGIVDKARGMMGGGGGMMARHHATIPDPYAGMSNPISADTASLERGEKIYTASCASCHGDGGMGDGPAAAALDPEPAPIAHSGQMLGDDYLFWRISEGGQMDPFNSAMIAWKGSLDEDARWDVVNYIQALGDGTVTPQTGMGGAAFDPAVELEKQAEMLATAVEQEIITQAEADDFALVHAGIDEHMAEVGEHNMGGMDNMQAMLLSALIAEGKITQAQADSFNSIHDRLGESGLME